MEQKGDTNRHLIPWKKAYLYALGWLVATCVLAVIPPLAVELLDIDMSELRPIVLFITYYIMLLGIAIIILRIVHQTWKVSIAYITELTIASLILGSIGLIIVVALMQGIGPVF